MTPKLAGKIALVTGGGAGIGRATALERSGRPDDRVFLSSDDAGFVLGHSLAVDGGFTAR